MLSKIRKLLLKIICVPYRTKRDFGAGYSNFNMLEALKVDFVKIDGSLINSVDVDENQEIIVDTIASYAKRTGIATVAEFVSKESIYDKINALGIDYAQGWYFGKPISYQEIETN
jgi:EAL domain-containing protein (putative c-di-GMP-specific phosphodiesterase class I)